MNESNVSPNESDEQLDILNRQLNGRYSARQTILEQIQNTDDPSEVIAIFTRLDTFDEDDQWPVISTAFDRLQDLGYPGIVNVIIDQSLIHDEILGHSVRSRLKRWVEDNPKQRDNVVARITQAIGEDSEQKSRNAIWAAVRVGFRTRELEARLVHLISSGDEKRWIALYALAALGYPNRQFIVNILRAALQDRELSADSTQLVMRCVRRLAPFELLPELKAYYTKSSAFSEEYEERGPRQSSIDVLYAFADIAERHPTEAKTVFDIIVSRDDAELLPVLTFWKNIAEAIDDRRMPAYLLTGVQPELHDESQEAEGRRWHYRPYSKLASLYQTHQLDGLKDVAALLKSGENPVLRNALHNDATLNTNSNNMSPSRSSLSMLKESAWDAVLQIGGPETRDWIVEALNETGAFSAAGICRLAGYFQVNEAVPKLRDWVTRKGWDENAELRLTHGLAVLEALGNIATRESFDALMKSRVAIRNRSEIKAVLAMPRDFGEAVCNVIRSLRDPAPLIAQLEIPPDDYENSNTWVACAYALDEVARLDPELLVPYTERVFALLANERFLKHPDIGYIMSAIGFMKPEQRFFDTLLNTARNIKENRFQAAVLETLARWNLLAEHEDLLASVGLELNAVGEWQVASLENLDRHRAFIIGLLYSEKPAQFAASVAHIIRNGSYSNAVQVTRMVQNKGEIPNDEQSNKVIDALMDRVARTNYPYQSDTSALYALASVSPENFFLEARYESLIKWHPATRRGAAAACSTIAEQDKNGEWKNQAADLLSRLLEDPAFEVRRRASRALGRFFPDILSEAVKRLTKSKSVVSKRIDGYRHGVEAALRLSDDAEWQRVISAAEIHPDPVVRAVAREVEEDRRYRSMSESYLILVLNPERDLLATWRYGQALKTVGDDEALGQVRDASLNADNPPSFRAYLGALAKDIEKNWTETLKQRERRLIE